MASDDPPARPRRERPLVAPGRAPRSESSSEELPRIAAPPIGPPVFRDLSAPPSTERDDHVYVSFEGPLPQNRWTVAFRVILAIPHFLWMYILNFATGIVRVIVWFAALFTGRVPDGLGDFLARYVRYQARLYGYMLFLTDKYPPFDDDRRETYAVNVAFNPGPLNRAAVLFRFVLLVPSMFVTFLVGTGVFLISQVTWLLTLIMGRLPTPLWEAQAAFVRYATRTFAFADMLTAEQPRGLFGDKPDTAADDQLGEPQLSARPMIRTLVLSQAAKRLLVFFMVAAALLWVAFGTFSVVTANRIADAVEQLDTSYAELLASGDDYEAAIDACPEEGNLACQRPADAAYAAAFDEFARELSATKWPVGLQPVDLVVAARECADALRAMSTAENEDAYNAALDAFNEAADEFDVAYADFVGETETSSGF